MRVHVLQVAYGDGEPVAERVARVAALVADQRGADLIVLPELWAPTGMGYRSWPDAAEPVDGPTVTALAEAARAAGATVHAGSILECAPGGAVGRPPVPTTADGGHGRWNTSVVLRPDGSVAATYRKVHRFGFSAGEATMIDAGDRLVTVPVPVDPRDPGAGELTLGLATCYDLRFPELFRGLLDGGAEAFAVPAAWPAQRIGHWTLLGRARAVENQCALVACNTAGTHAGVRMGGRSQVVAATGEVLAEAGDGEEVLVADLDVDAAVAWRERFPVLADRRLGGSVDTGVRAAAGSGR